MNKFPESWCWSKLIEICEIKTGKKDVNEGNITGSYNFFTCAAEPLKSDTYSFEGESILLPGNGANVGLSLYYNGKFEAYQRTYVLSGFQVYCKFIFYYLQGFWKQSLQDKQYGSATNYIRLGNITDFDILIPPANEQRRIVAKLEKLLAKVDTCKERLDKIPGILKRFRQSVLAAACSGRLTADWRENNPDVESAEELLKRIQIEKEKHYNEEHEKSQLTGKRKPKQFQKNEWTPLTNRGYEGLPFNWCFTKIRDVSQCLDSQRIPVSKDERAKRIGNIPYYGANGQVGWIDDYIFDADLVLIVEDETFLGRQIPFSYIIRGKTWVNNHAHVIQHFRML